MKDHFLHYPGDPPLFDGTKFSHWKVKMRTYLQSLDLEVWWTIDPWRDLNPYNRLNSIALNAIFMAMNNEKDFRRIRFCKTAKEAWDTLVKAYEWYKDDKETYLQLLDRKFVTMKMEEDEKFDDFFIRLQELNNTIGESRNKYSDLKINRKILRSLPPRFWSQRDTINLELLDISKMSVDTLVGKLRTCEADWDNKIMDLEYENLTHSKNSNGEALESCDEEKRDIYR